MREPQSQRVHRMFTSRVSRLFPWRDRNYIFHVIALRVGLLAAVSLALKLDSLCHSFLFFYPPLSITLLFCFFLKMIKRSF